LLNDKMFTPLSWLGTGTSIKSGWYKLKELIRAYLWWTEYEYKSSVICQLLLPLILVLIWIWVS
jgi:hypothetical protein